MIISDHPLVLALRLTKSIFELTIVDVELIYKLHLNSSNLLAPFLELLLDLSLHLHLPSFEKGVMFFKSLARAEVNALLMHCLVHVHQNLNLKLDLFHHIFLLSHIMTPVRSK